MVARSHPSKNESPQLKDAEIEAPKKQVSTAILHSACLFAGGRTESTLNHVKVPGIEMWWVPNEGLHFKVKSQVGIVPAANVKIVYFSEFR
jgi:hypothetical protein